MLTLLTPFRYLTLQHRSKVLYDVVLPVAGSAILTALLVALPKPVTIIGEKGYLAQLQTLLTILAGFFIAALTMITTDKSGLLAQPVGGLEPPRLPGHKEPLSRRRFLAYLFGYLSSASIVLVVFAVLGNLVGVQISQLLRGDFHAIAKIVFLVVFNFWLCHLGIATLLGLFYFTERLQIGDPEFRVRKPGVAPSRDKLERL
ncbi:hypothetical protein EGM87_13790 [Sphingobium sp. RSMS]|uniref:hypothetical protein n=1 Tax=Sphingobium sp. RSMS TaxID=520734 RepID=UPI0010F61923|nr:hypothetical protein [Sphingobium sp. RSMS]UXC90114.1 hypothetical protein EGM87_13790 [Sphingobium sp. RSMS]